MLLPFLLMENNKPLFGCFTILCSLDHPIVLDVIREIRNGQEREGTLRLDDKPVAVVCYCGSSRCDIPWFR